MRDHAHTLSDFLVPTLSIECEPCGRRGRYNVARLMAKYGAYMPVNAMAYHSRAFAAQPASPPVRQISLPSCAKASKNVGVTQPPSLCEVFHVPPSAGL